MKQEITTEQWEQIAVDRAHWRAVGTNTQPADRPRMEAAITKLFARINLAPPQFVWVDGPQQAFEIIPSLISDPVPRNQILQRGMWGCEEASWVGHYISCRDVCGVTYTPETNELLEIWHELILSGGWFFPLHAGLVVCLERHQEVHHDENYRLHSATGPAILCRDGYPVYAWHGTRVPSEWIEHKDQMDVSIALTWENIEQRRCAAEILGWDRVLKELNPKVIDTDVDPMIGQLLEVQLPGATVLDRFLRVLCGTGRYFAIPVPVTCQTALEANAATYKIDPDLLRTLEVRA